MSFLKPKLDYKMVEPTVYDEKIRSGRLKNTLELMGNYEVIEEPVLDVGEPNEFGCQLANILRIDIYNTEGDLDSVDCFPVKINFKTIWIFEVIEHLKNPDLFLTELSSLCSKDTRIFLSYPYRPFVFLWNENHYHEIEPNRFRELIESAGYEIIQCIRKWQTVKKKFIRVPYTHYCYELRIKNGG